MPVSRPFADSVDQKDSSQRSEMCAESSSTRYLLPTLLYFQYGTSEAGGLCYPRRLYQYLYSIAHPYLANDARRWEEVWLGSDGVATSARLTKHSSVSQKVGLGLATLECSVRRECSAIRSDGKS